MFYVQNISIYMNFGGYGGDVGTYIFHHTFFFIIHKNGKSTNFGGVWGDVHIPQYIFCLLFKKTEKEREHDLY